jgi:hypothetical protein
MVGAAFSGRIGMRFLVRGLMMSGMYWQLLRNRFFASSSLGRQDRVRYLPSLRDRGSNWLQSTVTTSQAGLYVGFPGSCLMMKALWSDAQIRFFSSFISFASVSS